MIFIAKILDSLIVDEAVNGPSAGVVVCFVHLLPEFGAPLHKKTHAHVSMVC